MIYPTHFEQKLGFDKIRAILKDKCLSPLGEEKVYDMAFSSQFESINEWLLQTNEFITVLQEEDDFPANFFFDVRHALKRIRVEGTFLDEHELFDLRRSLDTIKGIITFLNRGEEGEAKYPALRRLAGDVMVFPDIIQRADMILDRFGKIKDNASAELSRIRRELLATTGGISRTLQTILKQAQSEGIVERDVAPTMRDGRLVIPVPPSYKRKLRGIVHDESATGKTVYIEPAEVVEANNRIRELESEERREIVRILTDFTDYIRPHAEEIVYSYLFLADIDFIRAKSLFAQEIEGVMPILEDKRLIDWGRAQHPLLFLSLKRQHKRVVPLDVKLDDEQRIIIISGPNAGGKSVCLKTVGLLQYMLQCGMLISVHPTSRTGVFEHLFVDIGDEQSIENDLSTYSSHLMSMKHFIRNSNASTLFLIDEFGAGTEPQIGGAIAEAVLNRIYKNGAFGVITTHYRNLKHFADSHEHVVNGAMLYDRHEMRPLFQMEVGNPGSSFAIEIARKTGLPEEVIAEATESVGVDYINMDKYLQDIVRDKRYWEGKRQSIRQKEKRLEEAVDKYETDLTGLDKQRKEVMKLAKQEAERILKEANARIENTIREIKEAAAEKEKTRDLRKQLDEFKQKLREREIDLDDPVARKMRKLQMKEQTKKLGAEPKEEPKQQAIAVGDNVRMIGQTTIGQVLELNAKQAVVAFGMLKSTVALKKLERMSNRAVKKEQPKITFVNASVSEDLHQKRLNFRQEIDVRGMRGDEALQAVTYFVDDAIQLGVSRVRILHGTGNGILRQLIRDYLRTTPGVRSYQDEHIQFGGAGITVVDLD